MPCETIKVAFKPVNFFDKNPALDVPPSTQAFNKSVLLSGEESDENKAAAACCGPAADGKASSKL